MQEVDSKTKATRTGAYTVAVILGVTTTVSYGTLYYAFGVLARNMAADVGLSLTTVYGMFSLGLFLSGLLAAQAGKLFDRHDPAAIMAWGSALAAAVLAGWALTPGKAAFAIWLVGLQIASMLVLYEAAFVTAAYYVPALARRTITGITLIAGFASTIYWPLTDWMLEFWSWREICLFYAAQHGAICLPMHWWLSRHQQNSRKRLSAETGLDGGSVPPKLTGTRARKLALIFLTFGFTAKAFAISALHLHLIGLLEAIGLAASAAMIGALIGPSQVAGRLIEFVLADRISIFAVTLFSAAAMPAALLMLVWTSPWIAAAVLFSIVFGLGQGLSYIARGVFPLELFGSHGYGALTGRINAIRLYVSAGAPFIMAAILERSGAITTIYAIVLAGFSAFAAFAAIGPLLRRPVD